MTNDIFCTYERDDRDHLIVDYLYDQLAPAARADFEAHVAGCAACRNELADLAAVRTELARWAPPEPARAFRYGPSARRGRFVRALVTLGEVPLWAQAAAALLVLGVSAGIANLEIRTDRNGLSVRTGWSASAAADAAAPEEQGRETAADAAAARVAGSATADAAARADHVSASPSTDAAVTSSPDAVAARAAVSGASDAARALQGQAFTGIGRAPWHADLAALERQLRAEFGADRRSPQPGSAPGDAAMVQRIQALIAESERRQQRELALRVAELLRDVQLQRRADLDRIDRSLDAFHNNTGLEVMRQRQMINSLAVRVSQAR